MARASHDIADEPHLQSSSGKVDPSEDKATSLLRCSAQAQGNYEHSVFDETHGCISQDNDSVLVHRIDTQCQHCGYNLRSREAGTACPECGKVDRQRPVELAGDSWATYYQREQSRRTAWRQWGWVWVCTLLAGPMAIVATIFNTKGGIFAAISWGPVVEEFMKILIIGLIVETRPWWIRHANQIRLAALGGGLGFAIIENLTYQFIYIQDPSPEIILWRWTVCSALHVGCSQIAALGLIRVWRDSHSQLRRPQIGKASAYMVLAIILHASYNLLVTVAEFGGWLF